MSEYGSTESDEQTVEDQNRSNSESDDIHSVLSNFMDSKEETLEELVGALTFLTMDDLRKSTNLSVGAAWTSNSQHKPNSQTIKCQSRGIVRASSIAHQFRASIQQTNNTVVDISWDPEAHAVMAAKAFLSEDVVRAADNIEEEVLEEKGPQGKFADSALRHRPSLTKFDNFVTPAEDDGDETAHAESTALDTAEEEDEGWLPSRGYCASFGQGDSLIEKPSVDCLGVKVPLSSVCQRSQVVTSHRSSAAMSAVSESLSDCGIAVKDCELSVVENQSQLEVPLARQEGEVDGEDSESHQIEPWGAKAQETRTTKLEKFRNTQNLLHEGENEERDIESKSSELDPEAPGWTLNPGEVEEREGVVGDVLKKVSVMVFSMKVPAADVAVDGGGLELAEDKVEACSDEVVVPFSLDENFDYDNVAYTPKFTADEIDYLASFIPQKPCP